MLYLSFSSTLTISHVKLSEPIAAVRLTLTISHVKLSEPIAAVLIYGSSLCFTCETVKK
jgi:hypothetical protein